jgi:ferric-dicitrate binding protein FerR (iron transport regulator)
MAITASFLFFWILTEDGEVKYKTAYAETMQLSLPDGSTVVLNANSKLKFIDNWHRTIEREIWLDGEAFFEVQEKTYNQKPSKFIIHTTSGIEVTVLGTSFNVNDRKYKAEVVLNSGKVKLTSPQFNQDLFMIPGDMVSYQSETGKIEKKKVDPAQYAEWTNQQLNFTDEPLNEIIDRVETLFGLQIRFENFNPKGKRFTGATPYQDVEILLLTIAKAYGLTYEKNGNSIQLNKK